jgi:hypothetical protein
MLVTLMSLSSSVASIHCVHIVAALIHRLREVILYVGTTKFVDSLSRISVGFIDGYTLTLSTDLLHLIVR